MKLLRFTEIEQAYPEVRPAKLRKADFEEIYAKFQPERAEEQASRCSQCGIPFCQVHCPLHNNIPDWLKLTAENRLKEAYEVASLTNTFPEICGRICPQDKLCEGNCVIERGFDSVTIGSVEKYITDVAWEEGWIQPFTPAEERAQSVGIIGAGPAGLAAAEQIRRKGFQVTIYDRYDRVGGLMIYGIPNFKLDKQVVERRRQLYADSGVQFTLNVDIGNDVAMQELQSKHDAVLIATGVYKLRQIDLPGSDKQGVHQAMDFLTASNRKGLGDRVKRFESGELNAEGKRVVVIGGGDTAMDCVRTSIRQGAKSVTCLYRRDRENMPGSAREVKHAEEEGVKFEWLSAPRQFLGNGKVEGIEGFKMRLGPADASGRRAPVPVEDSSYRLKADMVIQALGFEPEDLPGMFNVPELTVHPKYGTLTVDKQMMTPVEGVFAAGDIVRGASLVVWAIADGREAAKHIVSYLEGKL